MVVAGIYQADAGWLFAVVVFGVAVPEQPLVVHLAQALGLHRFGTPFFDALVRFYGHAGLDRPNGIGTPLELHVMRQAQPPSVVLSATTRNGADVMLFAHKKKSPSEVGL